MNQKHEISVFGANTVTGTNTSTSLTWMNGLDSVRIWTSKSHQKTKSPSSFWRSTNVNMERLEERERLQQAQMNHIVTNIPMRPLWQDYLSGSFPMIMFINLISFINYALILANSIVSQCHRECETV
jgi:hypothetical protein